MRKKRLIAILAVIITLCMSFMSYAVEYEDLEYWDGAVTAEATDTLYINEVKTDSEYKYFIIYKGTDGNFYFSRVATEAGWTVYSNGRMQINTMHKTTKFISKDAMFSAVKTDIVTEAAQGRLDIFKENVYCVNFTIGAMKPHSWVEGAESSDAGTVEPEPNPDPGEDGTDNATWFQKILNGITGIPGKILEGIKGLFLPSEEFMSNYAEKIGAKFSFINDITECFKLIVSIAKEPEQAPTWYVTLPAFVGGERVNIINFGWLNDNIKEIRKYISAFIWIEWIWLIIKRAPDIISGQGMVEETQNKIDEANDNHQGHRRYRG